MSNPAEAMSPTPVDRNAQGADTDVQSVDSSDDSGSSSGSTRSGSSSSKSGSVTSVRAPERNQVIDAKLSPSSERSRSVTDGSSECESEGESVSDESESPDPNVTCKSSLVTSAAVEPVCTDSPVFATPRATGVAAPEAAGSLAVSTDVKAASDGSQAGSPSILTPAKSLTFESKDASKVLPAVKANQSTSASTGNQSVGQVTPTGTSTRGRREKTATTEPTSAHSNQIASTTSDSGKAKSKIKSSDKASKAASTRSKQQQVVVPKEEPAPPKVDAKRKKLKKQSKEPIAVKQEVKAVEPEQAADHRKRRKQAKAAPPVKKVKVVEAQSTSNGESASGESSPDVPGTSTRIGKIPQGRRFQRLAMSRAKRLGTIESGSIQVAAIPSLELSKALKKLPKVQFNIQPTHAYRNFHKLPGTMFPHVKEQFNDIRTRYGLILEAVSQLQLTLAIGQEHEKAALIRPEADSRYPLLWQFDNDLSRATANPADREAEISDASNYMVEGREIDFKDLPIEQTHLAEAKVVEVVKGVVAAESLPSTSKIEHESSSTSNRDKSARKKHKKHKSKVRF